MKQNVSTGLRGKLNCFVGLVKSSPLNPIHAFFSQSYDGGESGCKAVSPDRTRARHRMHTCFLFFGLGLVFWAV